MDVASCFRPDFQAGVLRANDAIVNMHIGARAEVVGLACGLQHNGVITTRDVAVFDFHVAAMVGVYAIVVRHIEAILHRHVIHQHIFAAEHVQAPKRCIAKSDVTHHEIGAAGEHEHFWPPLLEEPPLIRRVVARHVRQ
jgi:hypothetical protein